VPTNKLLVLNILQHLPSKLVEQWFFEGCIDNHHLHSTNICGGHSNIVHGSDSTYPFDVGCCLLALGLSDLEIELVALFLHIFLSSCDQSLVGLGGIVKRVDRCGFIEQSEFELVALETCVQVSFHKLLRENLEGHQPIQRALIVFVFGFGAKNSLEQISQLDYLDRGRPLEEDFILLREGR
jgi:hypothetical protein